MSLIGHNHVHALATAFVSLGGYQAQPKWFAALKDSYVWQILCGSVLIYQGGGGLDYMYSLSLAIIFFIIIHFSNYLEIDFIKIHTEKSEEKPIDVDEIAEVLDNTTAEDDSMTADEKFFGYPTY